VAYVPWIIITISNIVLDVVATINFTVQATKSQVSSNTQLAIIRGCLG
jgi:hypothetical protein